jgi:mono/diheme cytochrome c family protein
MQHFPGTLRILIWTAAAITCGVGEAFNTAPAENSAPPIDFNRDVRPILADNCFQCHGPDRSQRKADLRLDVQAEALAKRDGTATIVPGDSVASELYRRITSSDPDERMPPADSKRRLTPQQIELLKRWIDGGAPWQSHWSLLPPRRPATPQAKQNDWLHNPIDAFVLDRLEREGLARSPEADKTTLLRRVTLDLTGLPPTPDEADAFLADDSPAAYERVVDRLLASPRYGERMAARWLDGARYADSNGYQSDGERFMWRWRDWVIEAYNRNLPFDQFTVEQLAGDLLPGCTLEQRVATGFNRNHRGNAEGGIVPEEYAVEYVVDRVDTTATVWLGLTLGCARCHDHKFDPFTQRDYYQLFAYFNNLPERGKAVKYGNSPPVILSPTRDQQADLAALERQLAAAEQSFNQLGDQIAASQHEWEQMLLELPPYDWQLTDGLVSDFPFDVDLVNRCDPQKLGQIVDGSPVFGAGRSGQAAQFDGRRFVEAGDVGAFGFYDKFTLAAWVRLGDEPRGTIISRMTDAPEADGYQLCVAGGKIQLNLVKRWLDDALRVQTKRTLLPGRWHHVAATYDGSRVASGVKIYIDGQPEQFDRLLDDLNQSFATKQPLRIGGGGGEDGRFHGSLDDVRVFRRVLTDDDVQVVATVESISQIAAMAPEHRPAGLALKIRACFLDAAGPPPVRDAWRTLVELRKKRAAMIESLPTTMVMQEMPQPRETHLLARGQYDRPGEIVSAAVPASLPPLPEGILNSNSANNRLALARWLVDPANPLTARVTVNRLWQMLFGSGLVKTVDDLGAQGEPPSHPELLDWLATEFVSSGWDVKALLRQIVTSATYRQSSRTSADQLSRDPENRLLARGPRGRLPAEMVRDQALAASGLLMERPGGPSVKPYQPDGLWKDIAEGSYVQDHGESLYRRGLYTFWKRTVAPPVMIAFDAAGRETCIVRETRTNTPLQALALLNEVGFVEASRALAERAMRGGGTPNERIELAFRLVTARRPRAEELETLVGGWRRHLDHYRANRDAAIEAITVGETRPDASLDPGELAAYMAVAGVIMNLDEAVTKQ